MSNIKQLLLVADLEAKKVQHCAMQYQQANAHLQANQQKLSGLERYKIDYLRSIKQKAEKGIGANTMIQHHQFVGQLDRACEQQIQVINQSVLVVAQRKQQWLDQQKKQKAITHLIEIKEKQIQQKANKQEQQLFDELALQSTVRKSIYS
jgi:flagellar FliJ protein